MMSEEYATTYKNIAGEILNEVLSPTGVAVAEGLAQIFGRPTVRVWPVASGEGVVFYYADRKVCMTHALDREALPKIRVYGGDPVTVQDVSHLTQLLLAAECTVRMRAKQIAQDTSVAEILDQYKPSAPIEVDKILHIDEGTRKLQEMEQQLTVLLADPELLRGAEEFVDWFSAVIREGFGYKED